jgi:hypothetical protein
MGKAIPAREMGRFYRIGHPASGIGRQAKKKPSWT